MDNNKGKASKAVVRTFVNDLRFFASEVIKESNNINKIAADLNSSWNDPQYVKFKQYIDDLTHELVRKTNDINECANKIEERELKEI